LSISRTFGSCALAGLLLGMGLACQPPQPPHPDQVMALRQAQTRSFEVPLDTTFKAATTYLQDNFYQIRQASKENGLISAYKAQDLSGGAKFWGGFLGGAAAKKGDTYDVTFTFEAMDDCNTRVRCNITHGVSNQGGGMSDVQAVTDPALYKSVLDSLSVEVQRKHLTNTMRQAPAPGL
jgi:hypothetical protein